METISMFEMIYPTFKIDKPVKLIELFAGVGSQAMALRNIGADFEHYKVIEFDKFAIASYNAIHGTDFETTDITEIKGKDLEIPIFMKESLREIMGADFIQELPWGEVNR